MNPCLCLAYWVDENSHLRFCDDCRDEFGQDDAPWAGPLRAAVALLGGLE